MPASVPDPVLNTPYLGLFGASGAPLVVTFGSAPTFSTGCFLQRTRVNTGETTQALGMGARRWAEYHHPGLLRRGHDPLHIGWCFRWNGACLSRIACSPEETFVLGGGDVEQPRGFGVYLESVCDPCRDVDECARGGLYGSAVLEVEGELPFEDVERLVVLGLGVKGRCHPSRKQLFGEREPPAGLLGGGFDGHEAPEKPEGFSLLRTASVWCRVGVHKFLLRPARIRWLTSHASA